MKVQNSYISIGKSLLRIAKDALAEDKVAADMEALADFMKDSHFSSHMNTLSRLPNSAFRKVITATFEGKIHPITLNLLLALSQQRALGLLSKIALVFRNKYCEAKGISEILFRSAREFSPQEQLAFIQKLQGKNKRQVSVKFEVDPSLIGGAQIYERSYLTDYSMKNYLERLKKHLISQPLN